MLRVGLTGGIGAGKSTVADLFKRHGVPVIDADALAHAATAPDGAAYAGIVAAFGSDIVCADGQLDRARLRSRVFSDPIQRAHLESLVHPIVRNTIRSELARLRAPYAIIMIPLLVETGQDDLVDRVLVVDSDEALQLQRVRARGLDEREIRAIMDAQASRAHRLARADDVIENNGDLERLARDVDVLHARYTALSPEA